MCYELTNIETKLSRKELEKKSGLFFDKVVLNDGLWISQIKNEKDSVLKIKYSAFASITDKNKNYLKEELKRIETSILNYQRNKSNEKFAAYIVINYKGLIKLDSEHKTTSPESIYSNSLFNIEFLECTFRQMNYDLYNDFVIPLKEFIETEFKNELIANGLIDSPLIDFINAIANNEVKVDIKSKNEPDEYNQIYSQTGDMFFNLYYNSYEIESSYNKYLLNNFISFKSYIKDNLEGNDSIAKKLDFLNDLFINISEINDLFYTNDSDLRIIPQKMEYHRNDAIDKLKMQLFDIKISSDFNDFIGNLSSLVSIQHNYSNLSLKFIQNKTNLLKNQDEVVTYTISQEVLGKPIKESKKKTATKLQWRGQINVLIRIFYELHHDVIIDGKPILDASKNQIVDLLFENFINKSGDELSKDTILTGLNPSRHDKRAPEHKKYKLPPID